ncbi:hypothetical protein [Nocardia sp. NPDC004860]|uniref:hypothetical protein n=1 Tax=Nocardia sp. NPDC004860 TaxID=3154557 RepID=UPI0033B702C9
MPIYGEKDKPRALVYGIDEGAPAAAVIKQYCPTVLHFNRESPRFRWESWDFLVSVGAPFADTSCLNQLFCIQFGGTPVGRKPVESVSFRANSPLFDDVMVPVAPVVIPAELDKKWSSLVKAELLPKLLADSVYRTVIHTFGLPEQMPRPTPLVVDVDGHPIAFIYQPVVGPRECIYLPAEAADNIEPWLLAAFERWAAAEPSVFPSEPDWVSNPTWMTSAELAARANIEQRQATADAAIEQLQREIAEAESALHSARDAGDAGPRILLTGTGDELVHAVNEALQRLGFDVRDMDVDLQGQKREDLRVSDGDWTCVCEVKGYTTGGKPSDLAKLQRWVGFYTAENRKLPEAAWYVVNQFRERDPSVRKQLLWGHAEDVEVLKEQGATAIDTRSLFLLDKAVAAGELAAEDARALLRDSVGLFVYPPTDAVPVQNDASVTD